MTVSIEEAAQVLTSLGKEGMLAAIERAFGDVDPSHASDASLLLRLTLNQDELVESMAGGPTRVHSLVASAFRDLQIKAEARRAVLSIDMLDSTAVAELLGATGQNRREAASELRRRGQVLGVPISGRKYVFPAFQFDPVDRTVIREAAAVNAHLNARTDPWGVASWWISAHPRLDGQAPRHLLGTTRAGDLLILAGVPCAA